MSTNVTVAGQADIRQRLAADGLAALGLGSPLLSPIWTTVLPSFSAADVAALQITVTPNQGPVYAPLPGVAMPLADGGSLGLSGIDGKPMTVPATACAVLRIHPQARLRLERAMVATLQGPGSVPADVSLRPVPSTILIRSPGALLPNPRILAAGDAMIIGGVITIHDEHGLIIDPFAFAAAIAAILAAATPSPLVATMAAAPVAGPNTPPIGTPAAIAALAQGRFVHVVDLHGRPWQDPPATAGASIGFFTTDAQGAQMLAGAITGGTLQAWPVGTSPVLSGVADPNGVAPLPTSPRFGIGTVGTLRTVPLAWPVLAPGVTLVRDTLRVVAVDPSYHLLGNRTAAARPPVVTTGLVVPPCDASTVSDAPPQIRQGSPVTLLANGRSVLAFMGAVFAGLGPAATTGPAFVVTPEFDDAAWPLPTVVGPAGAWPGAPAAILVAGGVGAVLGPLAPLRTATTVSWVANTNDVVVTLPSTLPAGIAVRIYPIFVRMDASTDEPRPRLVRGDGGARITTAPAAPPLDTVLLKDPFRLGKAVVRPAGGETITLRADAAVTWLPQGAATPLVELIGNLHWPVAGEGPAPAPGLPNTLGQPGSWKGTAVSPLFGATSGTPFTLNALLANSTTVASVAQKLGNDSDPRGAPRLPTMGRLESLYAVQLQPPGAAPADIYRAVLTGGWLTRESDTHGYRMANPGAAGASEVHAPGVAATGQLGFDLWVAAAHRARPVDPTTEFAEGDVPTNWVSLQLNAVSAPPPPAALPTTIAAALLQTVPPYVETPELAVIGDSADTSVSTWITTNAPNLPNGTELGRQMAREARSAKYGRRDALWALRRAITHARELVYVETPIFCATDHGTGSSKVDLVAELVARLLDEPRLRVVVLTPREMPFPAGYEPWSAYFYAERAKAADLLTVQSGPVPGPLGPRPRVVVAHPLGIPGRPLKIRTTTVIVDDVWMMTGSSTFSRRGLTFDGGNDVVLADWQMNRGAGSAIRAHRKALMAAHLGVTSGATGVAGGSAASAVGAPNGDWVRLHQPTSAHEAFADALVGGGRGKVLPLWRGPLPGSVLAHPADAADPDGRAGTTLIEVLVAALGDGETAV